MSHVHEGPLATYNSLTDPNLAGFFGNTRMRRHLKKSGLVSRRGEIVSENQYRLNMARREHKKHVKDLLAQAIVHKTLDLERYRQVEIKKKLEEIAKIELVRRVRATRGRKGDEEVLPYLSPRSQSRPQSGKHSEASSGHRRPKSAPAPPRNRQQSSKSGYTETYDDVIYVDNSGRPVSPPPPSDRQSFQDSLRDVRPENIDTRHLYALDSEALQQYALRLSKAEKGRDGASSPYLLSQIPQPPRRERARSAKSPRRSARMSQRPDSSRRQGVQGNLMLHRQEPAMMHQGEVQTLCEITMKYHGPNLTLPRDQFDPTQEVSIDQQHCGGNTLPVFKERLQAGSTFSFVSRRHRGYPFSLTLYIDGSVDCRVSTCCEYKHGIGVKLGGKMGHFSLTGITGATPCYKCKLSVQAPPRSLKLRKGYSRKKKQQDTGEVVTVEGTPRKAMTPTSPKEEPQKSDDDNYDDDFEEEDSKENKYDDDFEEEPVEQVEDDRRHIIGLRADETRVNGKTISVDVAEKEKEQEKEGTLPEHRRVEGYSSEDEDVEGPRSKSIEITADIHAQKKESPKKRRRSSSSSSSSSSGSDKERTPRPQTPERKTRSPEPEKVVQSTVVQVHTARSEESAPPRSDRSERSTTSGSLTTETESTLESNRQKVEVPKGRRSSSSSSSSTLSSDSEDEKYQRKKREKKQRFENENRRKEEEEKRRKEEEEKRRKESEEREIERKRQLEEEERKRQEAEEERKNRFELQRQQSQDRLRLMEEQRKKQELERQQQMSEQTRAKEEERKKRQAEEERMTKEYEKQLSFIQSQRESESTLSVTNTTVSEEPKDEVEVEVNQRQEEKRKSSSSSSSSSESESEDEKKKPTSAFSAAIASLKTKEAVEDKPRLETSSSSSTETSSTAKSDTVKVEEKTPMKIITEEEKKDSRRSSSSSVSSSSSSSSGGEYTVSKESKQEMKKDDAVQETMVTKKQEAEISVSVQETKEAERKRSSSSSSSSSGSSSESESDEDNKKVEETKIKEDLKKETTEVVTKEPAKIQRKDSSSSTSSYLASMASSDGEFKEPEPPKELAVLGGIQHETKEKEDVKIETTKEQAKVERRGSTSSTLSSSSSSYQRSESRSDMEFRPYEKPKEPAPFGGIQHEPYITEKTQSSKPEDTTVSTTPVSSKDTEKVPARNVVSEDSSSDSTSSSSDSDSSDSEDEGNKKQKQGSKPVTSESEPETMHGGHDPDNVAKSGTSVESHLVKSKVHPPMAHYGSILPMVKDTNSLALSGVKLDDNQLTEITSYIAEVEHIKSVTLRNCALDDSSFQNVAKSLQVTHSSPNILNFSANQLGAKSLLPLSVAIKNKPSIEIVILNGNPMGNVGCKVLMDALVKTKDPFPFLRRGSGYLTPSEARQQKDVDLEKDTGDAGCNVKELDLGDCKIADAGVAEISRFLESNKTLVSLNLYGNRDISSSGWERLGQAMKKNKTLKTLTLDFTNIGDSGIENLAKGLRVNTGLRSLDLESTGLTEKGGQILRDLLKENTSIRELTVTPGNDISDGMLEEIRKYLALNNSASS